MLTNLNLKNKITDLFKPMSKKDKINLIATIVLIATLILLFFQDFLHERTRFFGWINFLIFNSEDGFPRGLAADFIIPFKASLGFSPYENIKILNGDWPLPYGSFAFIIFGILSLFPLYAVLKISYITFLLIFLSLNIRYFSSGKLTDDIRNIFVLTFATYPLLFLMEGLNIESYTFILASLGVTCYHNKKTNWASFFLVLATAIKLYPALFFIFYLKDKKYKEFIISAFVGITFFLSCFLAFNGTFIEQVNSFATQLQMVSKDEFDHIDGLSLCRNLTTFATKLFHSATAGKLFYFIFSCSFLLLTFFTILTKNLVKWKELMLLLVPIFLLPQMSFDYKLIFLFLPLYFFANEEGEPLDFIFAIIFAILLIHNKNFFGGSEERGINWVCLLAMYFLITFTTKKPLIKIK
jgi:hypothetical protein